MKRKTNCWERREETAEFSTIYYEGLYDALAHTNINLLYYSDWWRSTCLMYQDGQWDRKRCGTNTADSRSCDSSLRALTALLRIWDSESNCAHNSWVRSIDARGWIASERIFNPLTAYCILNMLVHLYCVYQLFRIMYIIIYLLTHEVRKREIFWIIHERFWSTVKGLNGRYLFVSLVRSCTSSVALQAEICRIIWSIRLSRITWPLHRRTRSSKCFSIESIPVLLLKVLSRRCN